MPAPHSTTLLAQGAVPVINENDTVATSEIRYGDNDRLAARVAYHDVRRLPGAALGYRWPSIRAATDKAGATSFRK